MVWKTLQKWKSVYSNANEYICEILSEIPEDLFDPILKKIKNGYNYNWLPSSRFLRDGTSCVNENTDTKEKRKNKF